VPIPAPVADRAVSRYGVVKEVAQREPVTVAIPECGCLGILPLTLACPPRTGRKTNGGCSPRSEGSPDSGDHCDIRACDATFRIGLGRMLMISLATSRLPYVVQIVASRRLAAAELMPASPDDAC
jgi:hypothetical protein